MEFKNIKFEMRWLLIVAPLGLFLLGKTGFLLKKAGLEKSEKIAKYNLFRLFRPRLVQADRLESDSYVIQFGNFNVGSGGGETNNYGLTYTIGQTAPGPFGEHGISNYFIGSGFQYIYQINTFGFSIDEVALDLGELAVGQHHTASNELNITTRGAGGYTIYAYEEKPLTHSSGADFIPDTTCDGGGCDETIAGVWSNQNVPGFGFNISSPDAAADFLDSTYFRQFADDSSGENMQVIMSSDNVVSNRRGTVTYKVGISGSRAAGNYQTAVAYVAVPGY